MADFRKEIEKRRTFAIISHPDAGKTTLTEKLRRREVFPLLLLYCSLIMVDIASIFWIHRDIRISRKIPIVP